MTARVQSTALHLAALKQEYDKDRVTAHESAAYLARADAYNRILHRVLTEVPTDEEIPTEVVDEGIAATWDNDQNVPHHQTTHCTWCYKDSHNTTECSMLRQCLLCKVWGHLEYDCNRPHCHCVEGEMCKVPDDHPGYTRPCRATIRSFNYRA
jgi:hypothetical protein